MDNRIRRVRVRLEALRRGKAPRGVRHPVTPRAEVAELARTAPKSAQLATALRLPPATITRWQRCAPRRALRRITIGPEPIAKLPPSAPSGAVLCHAAGLARRRAGRCHAAARAPAPSVIGSTRQVAVYADGAPVDMRKAFDGLSALVTQVLGRDPLSGDCYLFANRPRTRAKVLMWDGTGLCIYAKRLEQIQDPFERFPPAHVR